MLDDEELIRAIGGHDARVRVAAQPLDATHRDVGDRRQPASSLRDHPAELLLGLRNQRRGMERLPTDVRHTVDTSGLHICRTLDPCQRHPCLRIQPRKLTADLAILPTTQAAKHQIRHRTRLRLRSRPV